MTVLRDFDYRPADTTPTLGGRLRGVGRSPRILVAATIATLMVLLGVAPLAFIVVTWSATDWVTPVVLSALALMGAYVWADALHQAGEGNGLAVFAKVNDLVLIEGVSARGYDGSLFRDGDLMIESAVRTRGDDFVEIGDSFPVQAVSMREVRAIHDGRGTVEDRGPRAFLRAQLSGGAAHPWVEGVRISPALSDDLRAFLGEHTVEITRTELTVFGSEPLGICEPRRLRESFRLIDALVAENAHEAPSELQVAAVAEPGRRSPVAIVLGTLALVIVVPVAFAAIMGALVPSDGVPGSKGALIAVVAIVILVTIAGVGVRLLLVGRRRGTATGDASRSRPM